MTVSAYAELYNPDQGRHLFAFHDETIEARAQEILAAWDTETRGMEPDHGTAVVDAQTEARSLARAELGWPSDWSMLDGYYIAMQDAPLADSFTGTVVAWHWADAMPALPGV